MGLKRLHGLGSRSVAEATGRVVIVARGEGGGAFLVYYIRNGGLRRHLRTPKPH